MESELAVEAAPGAPSGAGSPPGSASAADIYSYEDYRAYMRDRFSDLQARQPEFSQRGLARKARIANPGFFNEVIKGRRRLSRAAAAKMAIGLGLSPGESDYFSALVDYSESREPQAKIRAGRRLMTLKNHHLCRLLNAMPSPTETLREIIRELEKDWVLQGAGLSIEQDADPERPPEADTARGSTLPEILDKLICLRAGAEDAPDPQVVRFSLHVAPRMAAAPQHEGQPAA